MTVRANECTAAHDLSKSIDLRGAGTTKKTASSLNLQGNMLLRVQNYVGHIQSATCPHCMMLSLQLSTPRIGSSSNAPPKLYEALSHDEASLDVDMTLIAWYCTK